MASERKIGFAPGGRAMPVVLALSRASPTHDRRYGYGLGGALTSFRHPVSSAIASSPLKPHFVTVPDEAGGRAWAGSGDRDEVYPAGVEVKRVQYPGARRYSTCGAAVGEVGGAISARSAR